MAGQGRHVEDEQDERYALRALLEVWEHRVEEAENGARAIEMALDRRPERGMTSLLRAGLGLLVVPLVVAGYAGLMGLLLPLVALRSVFRRRGRRQRLVDLQAPAAEGLLPARSKPFSATRVDHPRSSLTLRQEVTYG
jgi:CheY-like chemotaxis protein